MTALAHNVDRPVKLPPGGLRTVKVKLAGYTNYGNGSTAFTCYKGSILMQDVTDTDGYAAPKAANAASGDYFMGIAADKGIVDASTTADGAVEVSAYANGVWGFPKGNLSQTDVGSVAYASTDNDVSATSSNALPIGVIESIDATYIWVNIEDYFGKTF